MKRIQTKYFVDKNSLPVHGAVLLMVLSALFRLIGCIGLWNDRVYAMTQIVLPLGCNLLFALFLVIFGKKALWMTSFPFTMGSLFFVIRSFGTAGFFGKAVCILLYVSAAAMYISTTSGWLRSKGLLLLLLITAFAYYIAVEDLRVFTNPMTTVSFSTVMQEISSIFIILSFLFTVITMKNRKPLEDYGLPKMKTPKIMPRRTERKAESADTVPDGGTVTAQNTVVSEPERINTAPVPTENSEKNENADT